MFIEIKMLQLLLIKYLNVSTCELLARVQGVESKTIEHNLYKLIFYLPIHFKIRQNPLQFQPTAFSGEIFHAVTHKITYRDYNNKLHLRQTHQLYLIL